MPVIQLTLRAKNIKKLRKATGWKRLLRVEDSIGEELAAEIRKLMLEE